MKFCAVLLRHTDLDIPRVIQQKLVRRPVQTGQVGRLMITKLFQIVLLNVPNDGRRQLVFERREFGNIDEIWLC